MIRFALPLCVALGAAPLLNAANWPSWRGPDGDQVSPEERFPLTWRFSKDAGTSNVLWRVELPEPGNSSPIVWGSRVWVTQAERDGKRRTLICLDRATGQRLWQQGVDYAEEDSRHETNPHCASSPVTDGERVIASFASAGVLAWDLGGRQLWKADLGPQKHTWGSAPSPVIHGDSVLVHHGPGKFSALYALDRKTGAVKWKTSLPEEQPAERFDGFAGKSDGMLGSFSTPLTVPRPKGGDEIVMAVANKLRGFDPATGRETWSMDGMNPLVYTSASYGEGTIVALGGYFGAAIFAKPGGEGDRTRERLVFDKRSKKHRIGSPIVHQSHVYLSTTDGFAQCLRLSDGTLLWEERLKATGADGATWGSMVRAGDRLYVVNRSGDTLVLRAAPKFEVLATNPVGELSNSTLALSDGQIFLRTHAALYAIGESPTR
jgi:outer membrane protein assembly factor BamB